LVIGYVATGHGHFLFGEKKRRKTPAGRDHQTARSPQARAVAWPGTTVGLRPLSVPGQATRSHPDCRAGLILIVGLHRLTRENTLSADTSRVTPRGPRVHDGTIVPEAVDAMWGTDMTATVTMQHGQVAVFVAVDPCSAECVGIHAALRGTRHEALEPVRQGVAARFGVIGEDVAAGLSLRHDHGSQYMSRDFQREIAWLGATSSPAFIRAPEGNGCAERFIRTL
jgi:transposase InsO family protein